MNGAPGSHEWSPARNLLLRIQLPIGRGPTPVLPRQEVNQIDEPLLKERSDLGLVCSAARWRINNSAVEDQNTVNAFRLAFRGLRRFDHTLPLLCQPSVIGNIRVESK